MRGCGQVLAHGYAEGLRSTLAVHVPELYTQPRLSPRLRQPWVLVRKDSERLSSVRVAWVPLSCGVRGEAAVLEAADQANQRSRSEEHTSELQSLMRISYAVFCLQKKN